MNHEDQIRAHLHQLLSLCDEDQNWGTANIRTKCSTKLIQLVKQLDLSIQKT